MSAKRRGLGKGLGALMGDIRPVLNESNVTNSSELRNLPIDIIQRGKYQPRIDMKQDALEELANSIRAQGVVQPIVVRAVSDKKFEIIAGERRWRASQLAGLQDIPAVVRDVPDETAIAIALIENIQREDLNPIEEANALQRLIEEFSLTHQEAAEAVGRSRTSVTNLLRLLDLHQDVNMMLVQGELEMGHARALLSLSEKEQRQAAIKVVRRDLTVRETERLVRSMLTGSDYPEKPSHIDPDIKKLEETLSEKFGAVLKVQHNSRGKGRVTIHYNSLDELDGILAHLN